MDARDLVRRARRLELSTRRLVEGSISGRYRSAFRGRGVAFEDVRPYAAGDDVRSVDWNVTARRGELHVKQFAEERELTVFLAVDVSGSTAFGSVRRTKRDAAAAIAALVAGSAVANGDRVGLVLFTAAVERLVPPRRGRRHLLRVLTELLGHSPRSSATDVGAALRFLHRVQRRSATVFLVSDFEQAPAAWARPLAVAAHRHDVVPVVVSDAAERDPPRTGVTLLEDPESGAVVRVDLSSRRVREALAAARDRERVERDRAFRQLGLDAVRVDAGAADLVAPLAAFLAGRRRSRRA